MLRSDSVCNEGLKKMQALTRAKRQNKKPGSERELAPGPACKEGLKKMPRSFFAVGLELTHILPCFVMPV